MDVVPSWGISSTCGLRRKMEDAVVAVPRFLNNVPLIVDDHEDGMTKPLTQSAHFFGVYDGHGGSEVANYCKDRVHSALSEELEVIMSDRSVKDNIGEEEWRKAFTKCFVKVDDEVGGKVPETVGSTATVAIVCQTHIVVANCGDSRAVLYRGGDGREYKPLSVDHKQTREDECARIEAAGGKVMKRKIGSGSSVEGIIAKRDGERLYALAVSRAIGDRYWKSWVVPEPEVMLIPRTKEDRFLIVASAGLWDVMPNWLVCHMAWKRFQERKEGRCEGDDDAKDAAHYLSSLASERGSNGNISVVVVDLQAGRESA